MSRSILSQPPSYADQLKNHPWRRVFEKELAKYGMKLEDATATDWQDFASFFNSLTPERQRIEMEEAR